MNILIEKAAVYVLDSLGNEPLCPQQCMEITDDIEQYLASCAAKGFAADEARPCAMSRDSQLLPLLQDINSAFLEKTTQMADIWFDIMKENPSIPACELVFLLMQIEGEAYLSVLKLNHKSGYMFFYDAAGGKLSHCENILQAQGKPDEAMYIQLANNELLVLEKKYDIDGHKAAYIASKIAQCKSGMSAKEKLDVICEAAVEVNRQFYGSLGVDESTVAAAVCEEYKAAPEGIAASEVCSRLYKDLPHAEEAFQKVLAEHEMVFAEPVAISAPAVRRLEKQSLRSGSGVEVKVPVSVYRNTDAVEFLKNDDGTTSLLIKNILI
ncbi:MAG: nucleoid-associated protein [Oscillospiraceae bacterium]